MSRVEREEYEYERPDGTHFREIRERTIREVPEYASDPKYNKRAARRMIEQRHMWNWANVLGHNRKDRRDWYRKIKEWKRDRRKNKPEP